MIFRLARILSYRALLVVFGLCLGSVCLGVVHGAEIDLGLSPKNADTKQAAGTVLASYAGKARDEGGVRVSVQLFGQPKPESELTIEFEALGDLLNHYHLYPADSKGGIPLNIRLEGAAQPRPFYTDAATSVDDYGFKIFATSVIRVQVPVLLPSNPTEVSLYLSYLACSDTNQCKQAVQEKKITLTLPGVGEVARQLSAEEQAAVEQEAQRQEQQREAEVARNAELQRQAAQNSGASGIQWRHVSSVQEVEALIVEAHAQQQRVFLDFTGPSCINCQDMAKNIFIIPQVRDAWNSGLAIEINTDASSELAQWQLDRFGTYTRPLYVRLDEGQEPVFWNTYLKSSETERVQQLVAFLYGGAGQYSGSGEGWWQFIALALIGGLFTLVMPCTYPMIPLTVNFFSKQASTGRKIFPLALAYALGILLSFTLLGVIVGVVLGKAITNISGDPWINLIIGVTFIALGLSLMGIFFLRLPSVISSRMGSGQMGYVGALLMGLTFAVTAFTCTAPFAGAVLAEGARSNDVFRPALGMLLYASVIAVPFFFLSMSPRLLQRLPRAGSWMNEFKYIGGLIEIAAAFKFLAISDNAWNWGGIFGRTSCLSAWVLLSLLAMLYVSGVIRFSSDDKISRIGVMRGSLALIFLGLAVWMFLGLIGYAHLGTVESFFPGDLAPVLSLD